LVFFFFSLHLLVFLFLHPRPTLGTSQASLVLEKLGKDWSPR
jgi:hypothetical protein